MSNRPFLSGVETADMIVSSVGLVRSRTVVSSPLKVTELASLPDNSVISGCSPTNFSLGAVFKILGMTNFLISSLGFSYLVILVLCIVELVLRILFNVCYKNKAMLIL